MKRLVGIFGLCVGLLTGIAHAMESDSDSQEDPSALIAPLVHEIISGGKEGKPLDCWKGMPCTRKEGGGLWLEDEIHVPEDVQQKVKQEVQGKKAMLKQLVAQGVALDQSGLVEITGLEISRVKEKELPASHRHAYDSLNQRWYCYSLKGFLTAAQVIDLWQTSKVSEHLVANPDWEQDLAEVKEILGM